MKKYCSTQKALIAALVICAASISAIAQIQRNTSIVFYGKVIDQNDQPIEGATVKLVVAGDPSEGNVPEEKDYTLETGQDGNFRLTGAFGWSMQITSIAKSGYELSTKAQRGYSYLVASGIHHPDANGPVLFKMWKSVGKEPLVHSAWHGKVNTDGATNRFDMESGKISPDGDLQITCTRVPAQSALHGHAPFDYKVEIAILGGTIQAADDEFTYEAPETGYAKAFAVQRKAETVEWKPSFAQEFYIKTPKGHFGTLHIDWQAWQTPPNRLEWDCSINPSGSRNLER